MLPILKRLFIYNFKTLLKAKTNGSKSKEKAQVHYFKKLSIANKGLLG